jgi:cation diffusion facilitator family transporter
MSVKMTGSALENYNFQKIVAVVGVSLMLIKFFAYFLTSSVAILTDALESIVNVIAAFIGLFALYLSAQPPDRSHPFGHGKIETISASVEGTLITVAGALIIAESVYDLIYHPNMISDLDIGLLLIIFAAAVNYITGTIAIRKGKKNHSPALQASGKHLCTDTYSSIGIILGLTVVFVAMKLGYDVWWMDPLLALMFGAFIIITGVRVIKSCLDTMMDRADEELLEQVVDCLNQNRSTKWIDIHNLRMIKYGTTLHMEMHVTLPPNMTIKTIKEEEECLMFVIYKKFGSTVDLTLSPEPCCGFNCRHCMNECSDRKEEFVHLIEWTVVNVTQDKQHGEPINVHIEMQKNE